MCFFEPSTGFGYITLEHISEQNIIIIRKKMFVSNSSFFILVFSYYKFEN
jgi:hypothetical protein